MAIGLSGLAVALGMGFVVAKFYFQVSGSDSSLPTSDRLFIVTQGFKRENVVSRWSQSVPGPLAPLLAANLEPSDTVVRVFRTYARVGQGKEGANGAILFADADFTKAFPIPTLAGDLGATLRRPDGLVIAKHVAETLGHGSDVIGHTINLDLGSEKKDYTIGAVLDDLPQNSHLDFEFLTSLHGGGFLGLDAGALTNWNKSGSVSTYVLLGKQEAPEIAVANIRQKIMSLLPENARGSTYDLEPVDGLLFNSRAEAGLMRNPVDRDAFLGMLLVSAFVCLAAISNYVSVRALISQRRQKERAIKSLLGCSTLRLAGQAFCDECRFSLGVTSATILEVI